MHPNEDPTGSTAPRRDRPALRAAPDSDCPCRSDDGPDLPLRPTAGAPPGATEVAEHAPVRRWPYLILGHLCVALAAIGVVLPGLPTTPFLLVAAWAASRGSERLHRWLYSHRHFGPLLRAWDQERAVPTRAKWIAIVLLILSWTIMFLGTDSRVVPVVTAVLFLCVGSFLLTRPTPAKA